MVKRRNLSIASKISKIRGDKLHEIVKRVTMAGLLHDAGKVLHRGINIDGRAHSISGRDWVNKYTDDPVILNGIRYHHHQDIEPAQIDRDSAAYIIYLADNIASGVDRREIEGEASAGFDKSRPLESIYNLLNNYNGKSAHKLTALSAQINYPLEIESYNPASDYNSIIHGMSEGLAGIDFKDEYVNSLLELCEAYLSHVPSSTNLGEVSDISLFDHSKITAALAACIALYLERQGRNDYRLELFENRQSFYREKSFCLFSCDISGVQPFIYTISSKGALKGLRSRSFYLELLLENLTDEILSACTLYRTNLIYTGGGHAYILLPNTVEARERVANAVQNLNRRLMELYGARLYVAYGMQECSANQLMSKTDNPEDYSNIFRSVSAQISEKKLRRYNADEIRELNNSYPDKAGRECRVCGLSSDLEERDEGTICHICAAFADISGMLIKPDAVFVITDRELSGAALPVFSYRGERQYFYARFAEDVRKLLKESPETVVRIYSKNTFRTGFSLATKLWLGDYAAKSPDGDLLTFEELAKASQGVERIGVLRADVDNLGSAFVSGFVRENDTVNKYRYVTLSRTATLSRSLSIFFKYYLNGLMTDGEPSILAPTGKRNIVVVYSGGDDLFLVGAWNEVLAAGLDIRRAFARYTGNTLTISAGMAIFEPGYPIARMADETAQLEQAAKKHKYDGGEKNSLSLLGMEFDWEQKYKDRLGKDTKTEREDQGLCRLLARHTYDWDTFENKVLGEKFALIDDLFSTSEDYGSSFLYNILELLRQSEDSGINVARLAYLLARREPGKRAADDIKKKYADFVQSIHRWALDNEDRKQLITALIIYTYNNRDEKEGFHNDEGSIREGRN
jgi:CRISPR-associated protein Csm1